MSLNQAATAKTTSFYKKARVSNNGRPVSKSAPRNAYASAQRMTPSAVVERSDFETYGPGMLLDHQSITPTHPRDSESDPEMEGFTFSTSLQSNSPNLELSSNIGSNFSSTPIRSTLTPAVHTSPDNSSILSLLQQQQAVLQRVLDGQQSMEERQNNMEQKLNDLQKNVEQYSQSSTTDSGSDHKRKRVVTRTLSVSLIHVYNLVPKLSTSLAKLMC